MSEPHLEIPAGDAALETLLKDLPGERVTPDYIHSRIFDVNYHVFPLGSRSTVCAIELDNGFIVYGQAACVDPANFDPLIGRKIAYEHAFDQLWPLFGFLLAEKRRLEAQP
jgi:hypothetical protein